MHPTRQEFRDALAARHGAEYQRRLDDARVAICGLGGLGSNVAIALARAGVGCLHLIDYDRVDMSNLNRQQYKVSQLGELKTEALRQTLEEIAPYCKVETDAVRLTEENLLSVLSGESIVCEAFDTPFSKAMLVNGVLERLPNAWLVSGNGMAGTQSANLIQTRRVLPRFFVCGDGVSDIGECGSLFAARVMACAAHQALTIVKIIIGEMD